MLHQDGINLAELRDQTNEEPVVDDWATSEVPTLSTNMAAIHPDLLAQIAWPTVGDPSASSSASRFTMNRKSLHVTGTNFDTDAGNAMNKMKSMPALRKTAR